VVRYWAIAGSDAQMKENEPRLMLLIGRYSAVGALAGLLVGAFEGLCRYRYSSPPVLLKPDLNYVILFLGPLLDGLVCGFLGLITGLFLVSRSSRIWRRVFLITGFCLVAVLVLAIAKDPRYAVLVLMGPFPTPFRLAMRVGVILAGSGAFIAGRLVSLRTLHVLLVGAFAISLVGVGVYAINPSMRKAGVAAKPTAPIAEPNIILITLDTVRADHLSLYGYPRRTTPRLDKWARSGVVYDNAIAPTCWTLPSHASIFTGLLPHQHGAGSVPLHPDWWTLSDILRSRGYETAGFTSNLDYGGAGWGMGNGFELYDDDSTSMRHNVKALLLGNLLFQRFYGEYVQPDRFDRRDAGQINRDVLRWFHQRSPRPFYLFINYFDVHEPYLSHAPYASHFGPVSPWLLGRIESVMQKKDYRLQLPAEDKESLITSYDNCLAYLDNSVGELLDSLSRLPGWENTIVIITSDHGEGFGEHGSYSNGVNLSREWFHVPLIILGPNIPAGLRIPHVVGIQELFETVLQLAGMDNPPFQRASLQRFWRPGFEPRDSDEFVISELSLGRAMPCPISLTAPEWHYLHDAQGNTELYHWVSDPGEKFNLAQSPEYQEVLKNLQIQLSTAVTESLHPWRGRGYLFALGESERTLANAARLSSGSDSSSAHLPEFPIGTSQAIFPRRGFTSNARPPSTDQELLRSLPYH